MSLLFRARIPSALRTEPSVRTSVPANYATLHRAPAPLNESSDHPATDRTFCLLMMPRGKRSPPCTPAREISRVRSSPDITASQNEPVSELMNVTSRSKRLRTDFSPEGGETFEDRILSMLTIWKKEQESLLKRLTSDIMEVKHQIKEIQKSYSETEKWRDFMDGEYDNMKLKIANLEKDRLDQRGYITELEKKVEDLQSGSHSSTIEIRNVPSTQNETNADLTSIVLKTCSAVQVSMEPSQIRDVYRLPGTKDSNRAIIVEFLTVPTKKKVIEASRTFNKNKLTSQKLNSGHIGIGEQQRPVYVAEYIPITLRKLFFEARNFAKLNHYKFCWFQNGNIFLREKEGLKSTKIYSSTCFKNLQKPAQ